MCPGNGSICPESLHKENLLECNGNSSVCISGVCNGRSVCAKFDLEACFCEDKIDVCKVCCLNEGKCLPAQNITKVCFEVLFVLLWFHVVYDMVWYAVVCYGMLCVYSMVYCVVI